MAIPLDRPIPANGLTVLVEPGNPLIDIVFVHGFTGHPERTWLHKSTSVGNTGGNEAATQLDSEPPSKFRKVSNVFATRHKQHVYWPRDLLPDIIPEARVLTYGYDTRISHPLGPERSQSGVYVIARNFLVELEAVRRPAGRPILFVVHSLGGIVVKEMLKGSCGSPPERAFLKDVYDSTAGIVFFGTPHGGADPRRLVDHVFQSIAKAMGISASQQIIDTLLPSSERLEELRDHFKPMAIRQEWLIYSFQEALRVPLLGGKVVEDASSCLDLPREVRQHIHSDHMGMCRFGGLHDQQFQKVKYALLRLSGDALSKVRKQPSAPSKEAHVDDLTVEQINRLRRSLAFEQLDARQGSIRNAHEKTCAWLMERQAYLDWLDSDKIEAHCGFLWIKGKPGAGKSTIMKFICNKMNSSNSSAHIVAFFFNARGDEMEKTTLGMYRSLLLQLLDAIPDLWIVFNHVYKLRWRTLDQYHWDIGILQELLEAVVHNLTQYSVIAFIDALDECDDSEVHDMVDFMEQLSRKAVSLGVQLHICFASRHYPIINLERGIEIILEEQDGHANDIRRYIASKLKLGSSQAAKDFGSEVQEKAAGVFMWVVLVVQILNDDHRIGRGRIQQLRRRLGFLPPGLHDLFKNILGRDASHKDDLAVCLQWILFAKRPMSPEELYFAVLSGKYDSGDPTAWDREDIPDETIKNFILSSSKGLAEMTRSKYPKVQFIHESVRDFLLKEDGLVEVCGLTPESLEGRSHEKLSKCCSEHITRVSGSTEMALVLSHELPEARSPESQVLREQCSRDFPFLEYAVKHIFHHAEIAQCQGFPQISLIQVFDTLQWANLSNVFEKHQIRRYNYGARIDYVLAEGDFPNLLEAHYDKYDADDLACFKDSLERYGPPLLAAAACGSRKVLKKLFSMQASVCRLEALIPDFHRECDTASMPLVSNGRSFDFLAYMKREGTFGLQAIRSACAGSKLLEIFAAFSFHHQHNLSTVEDFVQGLIDSENALALRVLFESKTFREESDTDICDGSAALILACTTRQMTVVDILLKADARLALHTDMMGVTPLTYACRSGQPGIIKLVLEACRGISQAHKDGAIGTGVKPHLDCEQLAELMIEHGDDALTRSICPLDHYAAKGCEVMVNALMRSGLQPYSQPRVDHYYLTLAVAKGQTYIVEQLLFRGADVNARDILGQTTLAKAVLHNRQQIVQLLLDKGASVNTVDVDGWTPLMHAIASRSPDIAALLLRTRQAQVDSKTLGLTDGWPRKGFGRYEEKRLIVDMLKSYRQLNCGDAP